ncbi:F0F1 ATP synthase subunit B [Candidatus Saccharibacteria bacterium]|nr:MAG: F0F1 ATP synthase subunit B [Candidatus Saccharibacteria bacterium]
MTQLFTQFASEAAAAEASNPVKALGIDVKLLVFQIIAFALLTWLLSKYVFPVLMKAVDDRQKRIDEGNTAAAEAAKQAAETETKLAKLLKEARSEASDIVATAKEEAAGLVAKSEEKSKAQAERIVAAAHETIEKDVLTAKKALHNETIELVAQATKKSWARRSMRASTNSLSPNPSRGERLICKANLAGARSLSM